MPQAGDEDEIIDIEFDDIQAEVAELIDSVRYGTADVSGLVEALTITEFANPYHDERGRFARKGEGRAVPTKGVDDDFADLRAPDPNQTSLFDPPAPANDRTPTVHPGHMGTFTTVPTINIGDGTLYKYESDRGSTYVAVFDESGWKRHDALLETLVYASQAHDPKVDLHFTERTGFQAATHKGDTSMIVLPHIDSYVNLPAPNPEWHMPVERSVSPTEYTMAHEHGHIAHYRAHPDPGHDVTGAGHALNRNSWEIGQYLDSVKAARPSPKAVKEAGIPQDQWYDYEQNFTRRKVGLSLYAMTSPLEAVAESYAQAYLDPDNVSVGARKVLEMAGVEVPVRSEREALVAAAGDPAAGDTEQRSDVQLLQEDGLLIDVWGKLPAIDWAAWGHPERLR